MGESVKRLLDYVTMAVPQVCQEGEMRMLGAVNVL